MNGITLIDILADKNVAKIHDRIAPQFGSMIRKMAKDYRCFELVEALFLVAATTTLAMAENICAEDHFAARKLIDEALDFVGTPMEEEEGGGK